MIELSKTKQNMTGQNRTKLSISEDDISGKQSKTEHNVENRKIVNKEDEFSNVLDNVKESPCLR